MTDCRPRATSAPGVQARGLPAALRTRLRLPVMAAPMFLVSGPELVIACRRAGLIGSLTRNHCRTDAEFEQQLETVQRAAQSQRAEAPEHVVGPLAANVSIGMPPEARSRAIDACRRHGVDIVVTAGGDPSPVVRAVQDWGGLCFHDVTTLRFAEKAIAAGVDGIVAIGTGGGGHSGTLSPLVLVPQIRARFAGIIVLAGAVAHGAAVRAAEVLGADLAYLGTRFIATRESAAGADYKAMLLAQQPEALLYSDAINGSAAMWLEASLRRHGLDPERLPPAAARHDTRHLPAGVSPWRDLWSAGQGIGLIDDLPPVAELVERLRDEYFAACAVPAWAASGERAS